MNLIGTVRAPHGTRALFSRKSLRSAGSDLNALEDLRVPVVAEFLNSARLTIVMTSMVTARQAGVTLRYLGAIDAYLPGAPSVFPAWAASPRAGSATTDLLADLQEYYARAAFLAGIVDPSDNGWKTGNVRDDRLWEEYAHSWCHLCGLVAAITFVAETACLDGEDRGHKCLLHVREFARLAKEGARPCVRDDGSVFVPAWLGERLNDRDNVQLPVVMEIAGRREQAILTDISRAAVGLRTSRMPATGTEIMVHLLAERVLVGRVQWAGPNRIGVVLTPSLAATDPLLLRSTRA